MEEFAPNCLFAYGTLALPDVVDALTGRIPKARPATLAGYRCRLLQGRLDPGIERHPGSVTEGLLYEGLTPNELSVLDAFEVAPYQRRVVTVREPEGKALRAWAYVVPGHASNLMSAEPWAAERFTEEKRGTTLETCRKLRAAGPRLFQV